LTRGWTVRVAARPDVADLASPSCNAHLSHFDDNL
jgi:hypothetical protein